MSYQFFNFKAELNNQIYSLACTIQDQAYDWFDFVRMITLAFELTFMPPTATLVIGKIDLWPVNFSVLLQKRLSASDDSQHTITNVTALA